MPSIVKPETEQPKEEVNLKLKEEEVVEVEEAPDFAGAEADVLYPEDLAPETILFEGGPTAGDIVEWKKQYGRVYITEISFDEYIIWRTINRREYKELVRSINHLMENSQVSEVELNMYNEEAICQMCILFPALTDEEFDNQLAGMPAIISQQILEQSGFRPIDTRGL